MNDSLRTFEFRCPVHGFIPINDWEREIINQPAFQRLRRIRQLAWTDQVYPGAMHTRFEHSLGVMHLATMLFDSICERSGNLLKEFYGYDDAGFRRDRVLVRLAALLHDVGHSPFSHAGEDVFPKRPNSNKRFVHEEYSAAIIRHLLKDAIEDHPLNGNYGFKADEGDLMTDSLPEIRSAILARLVLRAPEKKLGRTQVMKLFYFLQELKGVALGYDFRLFTYGPFDSEVLSDLATACSLNQVKESPVTYSRGYGFDITAGPHADRLSCELETNHSVICSEVDAVIQDFGSFGAAELELRSTVLFVDREFCQVKSAHTSSEIFERVRQIKPHFSDTVIQERISEMKGKGWLQSIASS